MGQWSPLHYGTLPYLMVASVGQGGLQFYAIQRNTLDSPVPVSYEMDLATTVGRAQALIATINLYRLLHGAKACLPTDVPPVA